jgi:hypothetical protein
MAGHKPLKKGPHRVATVPKPNREEIEDMELESEISDFATRVHSTLQQARSKMSAEEAAEADKKAKAIFDLLEFPSHLVSLILWHSVYF